MSYRSPAASALSAFNRYREALTQSSASGARAGECPVCLGQHDEDIHGATIRVRRWFRGEVTRSFSRRPGC